MKKQFTLLLLGLAISIIALGQSKNSFKYQAILRDNAGEIIANKQVLIRLSILQESEIGTIVYSEEHQITSNAIGLILFNIGEGSTQSGDYNSIDWGNNKYFMKLELDQDNTGYSIMGTAPFLSVPYALHAQTVSNNDDADADPGNEIQNLSISNDTIYLTDGGAIKLPTATTGFSGSYNDLSDVPTNIDTDATDDFSGNYSDLTGAPTLSTVATSGNYTDLSNQPSLAGDASGVLNAVTVEKIQGQNVSAGSPATGQVLKWSGTAWAPGTDATVSGGGVDGVVESISVTGTTTKTIALGLSSDAASSSLTADFIDEVDDADANSTNEIQDLSLAANILTITNNGTATEIDLSSYLDNTDTQLSETQVDDFVANNGYLNSFTEVDGSITNEIQQISISGDTIKLDNGGGEVKLPAKVLGSDGADVLFCVVNNNDDTVFAVYESGVRIYVEDGVTKAARGGFAVATRSAAKNETLDILNVNGDSVRIYVEEGTGKAARGGFAVATRSAAKGTITGDILSVSDDSVRIYLEESTGKAARGGFAVATRSAAKGTISGDILSVSDDSVRIYLEENINKAARGGFAVATRSAAKINPTNIFDISTSTAAEVINNESKVMWYPEKSALLAGELNVAHADSVGEFSMSLGYRNIAKGKWSQAMGYKSIARGPYSTAIGTEAIADTNSFAFGTGTEALGYNSFAFGARGVDANGIPLATITTATGDYSFAFGLGSKSSGLGSFVLGSNCEASGDFSTAAGFGTTASGLNSTALGVDNVSEGEVSFTMGSGNSATGQYAIALGAENISSGIASISFGLGNMAIGNYSIVGGYNNTIEEPNGFAVGSNNTLTGDGAIAAGNSNNCSGIASAAFGSINTSGGGSSFAIGNTTTASGANAFSSGFQCQATADNSFALGYQSIASNNGAIASGYSTAASGSYSLSSGYNTNANGNYSIASGFNTTAQAYASLVIGKYNTIAGSTTGWTTSDPLFVAGNGTSAFSPNNALTLLKNGNMTIAGTLTESSDKRLKENIVHMKNILPKLLNINPVYFEFKNKESHPEGNHIGFIAQEIKPLFPELVHEDANGYLSVEYANMTAVLLQAVKEQQEVIENQNAKNKELENQIILIMERLDKLEGK